MPDKKANLIERLLFGENVNKGIVPVEAQEKGLFPTSQYAITDWATPTLNYTRGTFGGSIDYTVEAGDLVDSSVVMAVLNWLMRVFPQARLRHIEETPEGNQPIPNSALTKLLKRPNPVYSGVQLWRCTVLSYNWNGNAYWRKVRNGAGQVIQLWYEPHWTIRPRRASADDFLSYYEIWRDNKWQRIETTDVVHFRWVLSPDQQMLSMGPLDSALREIFSDNEAARYTAAMFRNFGVFSRIISAKDGEVPLTQQEIIRLIAEMQAATTGDNRGRAIGATVPIDIHEGTADLSKMNTRENRKTPEERISALLGIHPAVTGLGAGLDRSTFSNAEEAERWAYKNNILPCYDSMAEELDIQLVPDFTDVEAHTVEFDTSRITVLQGDKEKKEASTALLWNSDAITLAQKNVRLGYDAPEDETADLVKSQLFPKAASGFGGGGASPDMAGDGMDTSKALMAWDGAQGSKALPRKVESAAEKMQRELEDEIMAVYNEAAG